MCNIHPTKTTKATKPLCVAKERGLNDRKRVCAYVRVSTELDEQQLSFQRQIAYFTEHIQENPEWEFVGIYSDRGISATSIKHREGFKSMIADAKAGKIDLILCKSISRFARNVTDAISAINELKECGVEVQFERENISSFGEKGAVFFSILNAIEQEECRFLGWGGYRWVYEKRPVSAKLI